MQLVTLAELRSKSKELADMSTSTFVSDSVWNSWINDEARELYDLLIGSNEEYETTFVEKIVSSGNTIDVPDDFYKLRGLDMDLSGFKRVRKYDFAKRDLYQSTAEFDLRFAPVRYRLIGDQIYLLPEENAAGTYRVWYVPTMAALVSDSDTLDARNGWDVYVTAGAAIRALGKEESDTKTVEKLKATAYQRITANLDRDYGETQRISDVRQSCLDDLY